MLNYSDRLLEEKAGAQMRGAALLAFARNALAIVLSVLLVLTMSPIAEYGTAFASPSSSAPAEEGSGGGGLHLR